MKLLLAFLLVVFTLTACQRDVLPTNPDADEPAVTYLTDDEGFNDGTGARTAAGSGKITFEFLNNETEIFRPLQHSVRLWAADEIADPSRSYLDGLGDGKYDHPTYIVTKAQKIPRSYVSKAVKAGWYIAEFDGSGQFFKFNVTAGSDGLLVYNEHDFNSPFRGYFSRYGKIKVGWKKAPAPDASKVLRFYQSGSAFTNVWLYAEDGTTSAKAQYWFMPAGTYQLNYNLTHNDNLPTQDVSVTIAPGKTYPYVKLSL